MVAARDIKAGEVILSLPAALHIKLPADKSLFARQPVSNTVLVALSSTEWYYYW